MKKLQDLGFIKKLKDLPKNVQEDLEKDFKHFIPTTIAYKETSASTKTRICWDSSRTSRESASLNSILLKGSAEYSVVKMLVRFREDKHGDPIGFAAPLKVYGSYICRRALIESAGDPLKEVGKETKKLFIQYTYQVKMLENLTFSRNKHMLDRCTEDILILCTDAGYHASMMILYLGKKEGKNLKLEFVFSIEILTMIAAIYRGMS